MTPQSPSHRVHASLVRRSATLLAAATVIVGVPLVAQALEDEPTFESVLAESDERPDPPRSVVAPDRVLALRGPDVTTGPDIAPVEAPVEPAPAEDVASPVDPALEAAIAVLTDTYEWDERSPRVGALQELIGIAVDGRYGQTTHRVHSAAMEFTGLPTDTLPVPVLPPGPSGDQWVALRECEAGGDYSITNPSGKYRGAYQFDRSTWNSVAERHAPDLVGVDPAAASPADQDAMAFALYTERGARPWPHCGRHLN